MWTILYRALQLVTPFVSPSASLMSGAVGGHKVEYTGPYTDGGVWHEAFQHARDLVKQMTVEEKVRLDPGPCDRFKNDWRWFTGHEDV
jgi:hypothetical protein